jgi:Mg-chelatase subunit ChlD
MNRGEPSGSAGTTGHGGGAVARGATTPDAAQRLRSREWMQRFEATTGVRLGSRHGTALVLMDVSGSMTDAGRLAAARDGVRRFAADARVRGYSVGLITFNGTARVLAEATCDPETFAAHLASVRAGGSTAMHAAFALARPRLTPLQGSRAICVVTDGLPDDTAAVLAEAAAARRAGIDVLAIGTPAADIDFLRRLASRSELAQVVSTAAELTRSVAGMARLLPAAR